MRQPPRSSRRTAVRPAIAAAEVPSTLWALGSDSVDPGGRWPAAIIARAVGEFSHPGARVLLTRTITATRGRPHMVDAEIVVTRKLVTDLGRHSVVDHQTARATAFGEAPDIDLMVASLLSERPTPVPEDADRIADLATRRLAAGGLLLVLSRCTHTRTGILSDPTGTVVSAGQAAYLLYLQHIAAAPVFDDTIATTSPSRSGHACHRVVHTDISVFLQPSLGNPDAGGALAA